MATTSAQVQQLYVAYLGRAADKGGLDYWMSQLNADPATITLDQIRTNFVNEQAEYKEVYGGLSRVDTVTKIYNNLFGRAPDAGGLTYWTTGGGATVALDDLLVAFINGAAPTDAQTITNKVLVSEIYTSTAGSNFVAADAKAIIANVTDNASIATALNKLTDGSLGGIALPAAVATIKADAAADAAVTDFKTSNVDTLKALNAELVALSVTNDPDNLIGNYTSSTGTNYDDLATDIEAGITTARGALNTDTLTATVAKDTTDLATARQAFITETGTKNAVDSIAAYEKAVQAVAANKGAVASDLTQAQDTFTAYVANTSNATEYKAALAAAGLADTTTAATIITTLKSANTTDAQVKKITDAFASISAFASLKTQAGLERAEAVAAADKAAAEANLTTSAGSDWKDALDKLNADTASLNASKAVDAFEAKYKVTDTAHDALVSTAATTQTALDKITVGATGAVNPYATDVTAVTTSVNADATKGDVFYFANATHTNDFAIGTATASTQFAKGDAIYVGDGYTFNSGALTTGNNNAKEVFFIKGDNGVQVVIESTVAGSTNITADATTGLITNNTTGLDTATVITLTGVTDVAQLSFANGVVTHV